MVDIFDGSMKIKDNSGNTVGITETGQLKLLVTYNEDAPILNTVSGVLQAQITQNANDIANLDLNYATDASLTATSGVLQTQITANANAIANLDVTYASDAELATVSGLLNTRIETLEAVDPVTEAEFTTYSGAIVAQIPTDFYTTSEVDGLITAASGISFANTISVAKSGGDYTTIQAAIDSITDAAADNVYAVVVYPGNYEENITLKNYVNLVGLPDRRDTRITATSGTLLTLPANEAHLSWIDLYMTPTSDSDILIDATAGNGATGFYRIEHSDIYMAFTADLKPKVVDAKVGVGLYLINDTISYYADNTSTTGTHTPVLLQAGNNLFYLLRSILRSRNGSASADIENIRDESTGRILEEICTLQATCTHPSYSGTATTYAVYGDFGQNKQFNNVVVECEGNNSGTCYVCIVDSTSGNQIVNTSRNVYDIDGFGSNMRYSIGSGDTIYSYFNRHITDMSDTKIGNLREIDVYNNDDFIISEKIGIGTNAPDCSIHIQGSDAKIRLDRTGSGGDAWDVESQGTTGNLAFTNDDTSTTAMTITPSGIVSLVNGTGINEFSTDDTLSGDSDLAVPTEQAVKAYVSTVSGVLSAEIDSDITTHTSNASAHHVKYTDEEAQDAIGTILVGAGSVSVDYDDATPQITISGSAAGGINNIVEDTTPQLGGNLDANTYAIVAADHGTASSHQVVNVVYSSTTLPTASGVTEGTIGIIYTA